MNRKDIMSDCPEEYEDQLKDVLDYFESKFDDIKDRLKISSVADLCGIEDALEIATEACEELY